MTYRSNDVVLPPPTMPIAEASNPPHASSTPYLQAMILVAVAALTAVTLVLILRPGQDNVGLVTQIFGFATTTLGLAVTFIKSNETREVVNSRMDEFKRHLEHSSLLAQRTSFEAGKNEGRDHQQVAALTAAQVITTAATAAAAAVAAAPVVPIVVADRRQPVAPVEPVAPKTEHLSITGDHLAVDGPHPPKETL